MSTELKLRSPDIESLRQIIQSALSERLQSLEAGIKRTEERIKAFETQKQSNLRGKLYNRLQNPISSD